MAYSPFTFDCILSSVCRTHRKRKHEELGESSKKRDKRTGQEAEHQADAAAHGGWEIVRKFSELHGSVAIQSASDSRYLSSLDDGEFELSGQSSSEPAPEQVFTVIRINETKIALKTGFGKYISVAKNGRLTGISDAVGTREQFEPVFEEEAEEDDESHREGSRRGGSLKKAALCASNGCFLSMQPDDADRVACKAQKAAASEFLYVSVSLNRFSPTFQQSFNLFLGYFLRRFEVIRFLKCIKLTRINSSRNQTLRRSSKVGNRESFY